MSNDSDIINFASCIRYHYSFRWLTILYETQCFLKCSLKPFVKRQLIISLLDTCFPKIAQRSFALTSKFSDIPTKIHACFHKLRQSIHSFFSWNFLKVIPTLRVTVSKASSSQSLISMSSLLKKNRQTKESEAVTARVFQYVRAVNESVSSLIWMEKKLVMKLIGRKKTLSFARRVALRVSRAVA